MSVQAAQLIAESANVPAVRHDTTRCQAQAPSADLSRTLERLGNRLASSRPASWVVRHQRVSVRSAHYRRTDIRLAGFEMLEHQRKSLRPEHRSVSPVTFWQQYHWYVVGALAIIAIEAVSIVGLLLHRAASAG